MKKTAIILLVVLMLCMTACGKSEAAKTVDDLILGIGEVTLDSESKITTAETALAALSEEQKEELDNTAILVAARASYDDLVLKKQAADVDAVIDAIGAVTLDSEAAIAEARSAYDAAAPDVQSYVTKLAALENAEKELASAQAQVVIDQINAMGEVSLENGDAITAAKDAYYALPSAARELVSNANVLTDAVSALKEMRMEEAEKLLSRMRLEEDKVRGYKFYYPKVFPYYDSYGYWGADVRCFVLPYIGMQGESMWLRLVCDYTADDWVFFEQITFAVDEQRFYRFFNYYDVVRDNAWGDVWEYVDIDVGEDDIALLKAIADSNTTIVRFEGDEYYRDFTINEQDKKAIKEVLAIYEAFK